MEDKIIYMSDSDNDGLTDAQELALGTNPLTSDTDSDGRTDLEELQGGSLPNLPKQKENTYDVDL